MSQSPPTPDPVAWMVLDRNDTPYGTVYDALEAEDKAKIAAIWSAHRAPYRIVPLYDHPSALPDTTPRDPMTTDALCATHGKSIYEHTAEAICRCFGLAPCPACRGDRLTDGSSRCATCGACGVVLSVRDDARVSDARLMSKSWTPELRARLIATYDMRYEDLSADAFEDSDGEMSRREKSERAMSAVLSVFRWWLVSGEVKHWREARAALESYSGVSPSEGSAPDTPTEDEAEFAATWARIQDVPPSAPDTKPDETAEIEQLICWQRRVTDSLRFGVLADRAPGITSDASKVLQGLERRLSSSPPEGEDTQRMGAERIRIGLCRLIGRLDMDGALPSAYVDEMLARLSGDHSRHTDVGDALVQAVTAASVIPQRDERGFLEFRAIDSARAAIPPQKRGHE